MITIDSLDTSPGLDAADRGALDGLARLAATLNGAASAAWVAPKADAAGGATLFDAAVDGQVLARLRLCGAAAPDHATLAPLLAAAAALLRARAELQTAHTEAERLRDAGSVASDWLWETDVEGRVTWMSDAVSARTGLPPVLAVGRRPLDLNRLDPRHAAAWQAYQRCREARQPFRDLVLERDTPDGPITVSASGVPRFAADGRFLGYRGASRNVTAELRARDEAEQARRLLEQTIEGMPAAVMISGEDDRILLTNARWRETLGVGLPPDCDTWTGVVRHHALAGHYPDAIGRVEDYVRWRVSLAQDKPRAIEVRWRDEWAMSIDRRLPGGSVVHLSMFISERRRSDEARALMASRWRYALDGAGHGVWDWDAETDSAYFSPAWCAMVGCSEQEVGKDWRAWSRRVHPEDWPRVKREILRHRAGETEVYECEYRLRHADGHWLWIHDRGRVVRRAADGRPLRIAGTHSDITRQREAEQVLRDKLAAEAVSRSKSEFLSRMSHEMRTPLNALIGFAELMQRDRAYRGDHVGHILTAGRHLLALVNDVLDLQQVEQGALAMRPEALPLADAVQAVCVLLQPQAAAAGVTLDGAATGLAGHVHADRQRLRQVLLNLAANAVQYNRPGGGVRFLRRDGDPQAGAAVPRIGLAVEDDGPGLTPDQLGRLFQPFERLGREAGAGDGSGLGLLIARRLTEAMGGELDITSELGRGTRVTVWLPRADAACATAAPDPAAAPPAAPGRTAPGRVLYVEDNALNALLFAEALRDAPHVELRVVANAAEALDAAAAWHPDLLVIDGHLPDAKGHQVLERLRALPGLATTPAVMCSADALPEDRARAFARGFSAYWSKPLDVHRLPVDIARLLADAPRPPGHA